MSPPRFVAVLTIALISCGPTPRPDPVPTPVTEAMADAAVTPVVVEAPPATPIADAYRDVAEQIVAAARGDQTPMQNLTVLTDQIGHRLAGSKALDQAVAWAAQLMTDDGHDVRKEKVMVPHWVRGAESARMTAPVEQDLPVLGLGGTVATPKGGITASVVVVTSWEDLEAKADQIKGKIVLWDVPMPTWSEEGGTGYGQVVGYRWAGPSQAARHGAVASLMRSVTARSMRTPHTGSMGYDDKFKKIPAAAITVEDAELIHRLVDAGKDVKVKLVLSAKKLADVESANVIGELKGSTLPDEVVVIGAHLDSWDVGQGAHDDGAGCVAVMRALTVLRTLGLSPRRTIRVVLFTNEENGLAGARGYFAAHEAEVGNHVMALEMDMGGFAPWGFEVDDGLEDEARAVDGAALRQQRMIARVAEIATLLEVMGATRVEPGHGGSDIGPLAEAGVPALGLLMDNRTYFDYHHTAADTLDKVDAMELADDVAAVAVMAYVVADMEGRLDDPLEGESERE